MGVDLERFCVPSPEQRRQAHALLHPGGFGTILYAGRFDLRQKQLELLIEAWSEVHAPGWELVLVGDGVDRAAVADLVDRSTGRTRVLGWFDDVATVLHSADAFVLPTRFENPGYALFEAMACGLPGLVSEIDIYRQLAPDGVEFVPNRVEAWVGRCNVSCRPMPTPVLPRGASLEPGSSRHVAALRSTIWWQLDK